MAKRENSGPVTVAAMLRAVNFSCWRRSGLEILRYHLIVGRGENDDRHLSRRDFDIYRYYFHRRNCVISSRGQRRSLFR